jgi:3'-5' exonuclease
MIDSIDITNILFLDIETVPGHAKFDDLDENFKYLWGLKARAILKKYDEPLTFDEIEGAYEKAGMFAEFGKIICISVGFVARNKDTHELTIRLKSFADDDEKVLLNGFVELLNKYFNFPERHFLCGHNIKEFDIPFLCRRMMIHKVKFPRMLDISGKKPWETKHLLDTLELWKFGDNKSYTSLKLLAAVFGFPSPKDDIDGSEVARVYYVEQNLKRISVYCEKDVLAVAQLFLKMRGMDILEKHQIIIAPSK